MFDCYIVRVRIQHYFERGQSFMCELISQISRILTIKQQGEGDRIPYQKQEREYA